MWSHDRPIPLSERVPVLENMGFRVVDERTYHVAPKDRAPVWFHDMTLESALGRDFDLAALKERLEACFLAVMGKKAESDGYNALVLASGLGWRDVALIRTISRFLRQIRVPYSQDYMWATLAQIRADRRADRRAVPDALRSGSGDFAGRAQRARDGDHGRDRNRLAGGRKPRRGPHPAPASSTRSAPRSAPISIRSADDGSAKDLIAIKFSSRKVDGMPLPRPLYEIFVYSPRLEAVHLRFGKVARGGIRWSDRPQDFRTEILGLVKAQNVKNAVIVPVGAKGGFVPKYLPVGGPRDAIQAEGVAAYKLFISTLLDITDNIGAGNGTA